MRWILTSLFFALTVTYMLAEEPAEVHQSISGRAAEEQLQRVKRVSIDDDVDFDSEAKPRPKQKSKTLRDNPATTGFNFPVVLPPYGRDVSFPDNADCLLYLENITIIVLDLGSLSGKHIAYSVVVGGGPSDKFNYASSYVNCPVLGSKDSNRTTFDFTVDMTLGDTYTALSNDKTKAFSVTGQIKFKLNLNESFGISFLNAELSNLDINILDTSLIKSALKPTGFSLNDTVTNIRSYFRYNFACSSTQAIWFQGNPDYLVGIALNNVQIQSSLLQNITEQGGKTIKYFSTLTADCQSTFSPGSWMGIIVTIILVTVLMFGFLMLNSVQTMDRFDDPKQKQIVINFKE